MMRKYSKYNKKVKKRKLNQTRYLMKMNMTMEIKLFNK